MPVIINGKIYLSLSEVAERTHSHYKAVHHWLKAYGLPTIRILGLIALAEDDLAKLLSEHPILARHKTAKRTKKPKAEVTQ
ncbi:MAG: hypothetical protein ACJ71W_21745 [Terriglobales bacterium]